MQNIYIVDSNLSSSKTGVKTYLNELSAAYKKIHTHKFHFIFLSADTSEVLLEENITNIFIKRPAIPLDYRENQYFADKILEYIDVTDVPIIHFKLD